MVGWQSGDNNDKTKNTKTNERAQKKKLLTNDRITK